MSSMSGPVMGPCEAWVTGSDVAACCSVDVGTDATVFDTVAVQASMLLFELSGRQFSGVCEQTVRPCVNGGGCWNWITWPMSPGAPQISYGWGWWAGRGWGWGYGDGSALLCGCSALSRAKLPGYPVVEILEVKIDGTVIDPSEYRLDEYVYLTRMADPTTLAPRYWPSCQRLDLDDDQPGTWSVTYDSGVAPPVLGVSAAAQLACELYRACAGLACALPVGTTKLTRQGIEIERAPFLSWGRNPAGHWQTGLSLVDAFLMAYNPSGLKRRPQVFSPDIQQYAKTPGSP